MRLYGEMTYRNGKIMIEWISKNEYKLKKLRKKWFDKDIYLTFFTVKIDKKNDITKAAEFPLRRWLKLEKATVSEFFVNPLVKK